MQINFGSTNVNNQKQSNNNKALTLFATGGALTGGVYKIIYPSEKDIIEINKLQSTADYFIPKFLKCFNYKEAKKACKDGSIDQQTFEKLKNTLSLAIKVFKKDRELVKIMNTHIKDRTKTYKETFRELFNLQKDFSLIRSFINKEKIEELNKINILCKGKYLELHQEIFEKTIKSLKIRFKSFGAGLITGAAISLAIGFGIKSLVNHKD